MFCLYDLFSMMCGNYCFKKVSYVDKDVEVERKMADFAGSVILQLMLKQEYVEKRGIKALLEHIREGCGTLTAVVSEQRAEEYG